MSLLLLSLSHQFPFSRGNPYCQILIYLSRHMLCTHACSVTPLCLTFCYPMDCNLLGSSIHGIFQARILAWVSISHSRESSWPREWTESLVSPALAGGFFTTEPRGKPYSQVTDLVISTLIGTFAALRFINFWPIRHFKYKCNKIIQFFILSFLFKNLYVITISGVLVTC